MSFMKKTLTAVFVFAIACNLFVFGYDPPQGAFFLRSLYSPWGLASTPTVTGPASPWASLLNPSVTGGSQLTQIEGSYTGITDFGTAAQGWGSGAALSFSMPVPYGVWGGNASFFSAPGTMTDMDLGTFGTIRASFSKDLLSTLYIGSAIDITLGGNANFGWGVGLDLGATWFAGNLGFLKDTRFGLSILDIGKGYSTVPLTGIFGGAASSYPSAFTLGLGMRSYLLQSYNWNLDVAIDLWSPSFQDLGADLSVGFGFREYVSMRMGWSIGLRDTIAGSGRSYLPSLGLSATIPLGKGLTLGKRTYKDASIGGSLAIAPLYDSLYAMGAGFNLSFGIKDKSAPVIQAELPVPFRGTAYISPDGDGEQDTLTIPVKISDERYIAGWKMTVEDKSSGKTIKTLGTDNDRVETVSGLGVLGDALIYTKKNVDVPASIVWDGRDDLGMKVPDGAYTVSLVSWDDNGNNNLDYQSCITVVVDAKKPQANVWPLEPSMLFSPDGDGSKDNITFRSAGSPEKTWTIDVADASGKVIRAIEYEVSAPRDFTWDGTANDGKRVLDGTYSLKLSAKDEAGNKAVSEVRNIAVDTTRPAVTIATDELVMSPNGDGAHDSLHITTSVESFAGLESWKIFVLDPERKEVWTVSGGADAYPEKSYLFTGVSSKGETLVDGQFEAGVELRYANGYSPQKLSAPFYMDRTPPSASIALSDENNVFSPDNDGSRDKFIFSFKSTDEDTWNLIIRDAQKSEKVVRRYTQILPEALEWNGRDDQGKIVPDGEYEVYVFAVDRAGNSFATTSNRVRVDTRKPTIALSLNREAFSPNNDGIAESVTVSPEIETKEGLVSWKFAIVGDGKDAKGGLSFGSDSGDTLAATYVFEGKDKESRALPEGRYKAQLELSYINGFVAKVESAEMLLDRTYPSAQVKADKVSFNPAGGASQSKVSITQSGTKEDLWLAKVLDSKGNAVKKWNFAGELPSLAWDGVGDSGLIVPDGAYKYMVEAMDKAGNGFASREIAMEVDTQKKEVKLATDSLGFSPNGDGVKDVLTLSSDATAGTKLTGWTLWIVQAEASSEISSDRKAVKSWQGGLVLPRSFEWNGQSDSGIAVPDGAYTAILGISYPNGDKAETKVGPFIVDRIAPRATVAPSVPIFSPNGDGVFDTITLAQEGSAGDVFGGTMNNAKGEVVGTWSWNEKLESLVWDGKDGQGTIVPDGSYYYELASSDAGGNSYSSGKLPIGIETEKKAVRLDIDQRAFSPNGDGIKDKLALEASATSPTKLAEWTMWIAQADAGSESRKAVKSWQGGAVLPRGFEWNGQSDSGIAAPDGAYIALLNVTYPNGDKAETKVGPFAVDRIAPRASVSANLSLFSPNGDGVLDTITFAQEGTAGDIYRGTVSTAKGDIINSWAWSDKLDSLVWNGKDSTGSIVPDGSYTYELVSSDAGGNSYSSGKLPISVETEKKAVRLSVDQRSLSPNGDGFRDDLGLNVFVQAPERVKSYELRIVAQEGPMAMNAVRVWKGSAAPQKALWKGEADSGVQAPDGRYAASITVHYFNGDVIEASAPTILLDRVMPKIEVSASLEIISPNGDGRSDSVDIRQSSLPGDDWTGSIRAADGRVVKTFAWQDEARSFTWDGRDDTGSLVRDGKYRYSAEAVDGAGNKTVSPEVAVTVETEKKAIRLDVDSLAFSPNGDGTRDEISIGAIVQAPERVKTYELSIVAQDGPMAMSAVRTWKGNGAPPQKVQWKGEADSGMQAPDGRYVAGIKVNYFNGDEIGASTQAILLDRIMPRISVSASLGIISPNGDGRSDGVEITQNSLVGDNWIGNIKAADGRIVKGYTWQNEAQSFSWNGVDDTGAVVRDGIYRYSAEAVDGAGNRTVSPEIAITVESEKKTVRLDANTLAFSPNGDGKKDSILFGVRAQYPERIKSFELLIVQEGSGASNLPVKSWRGASDIMGQYFWDGVTDSGLPAPDGNYRAKLSVLYMNDDSLTSEVGPFIVDRVAPQATLRLSANVFSPNGDGRSDAVDIIQEALPGDAWQGQIISSADKIVRYWAWDKQLGAVAWDGKNQTGAAVPDGQYYYELRSIDQAENSFVSRRLPIEVDAAKKTVRFDIDQSAFSPNGDNVKDALYINIQAPKPQTIKEYEITVHALDAAGKRQANPVKAWRGSVDMKDQYSWDGRTDSGIPAPDGKYQVALRLLYNNDDAFSLASPVVLLDTVGPTISALASPLLFSPNGDGNKDTVAITQNSSIGDDWTGRIRDASGAIVKTWSWKSEAKSFVWDGKNASGAVVRDGTYSYEVGATDMAGNAASAKIAGINVDGTKPKVYVTTSDTGMSPNGDGIRDEVSFTIVVEQREGIESWRFSLADRKGVEKSFFGGSGSEVPARLVWDGRDLQGQVVQGDYIGKLVVNYAKGDVAQASSVAVLVDVDPPAVSISVDPEYFSPDGDGSGDRLTFGIDVDGAAGIVDWKLEVFETAIVESSNPNAVSSERLFTEWNGKGKPPAKIVWDGKSPRGELVESASDYPFKFVARDALGNSTTVSGVIAVDVLVIRDGDKLKIKVPSIVFRANYADFIGLSQDIISNNEKVVARVAQILNKFPDYRILTEGHANNVGKMLGYSQARIDSEETKELIPLSTGRAELVRAMLVQNGVDSRRLSVEGLGSSRPVVSFSDVENRWKNRRVEFVLIKNQ